MNVKNINDIRIIEKNRCYGCGACEIICPKGAINMQIDENGFWVPIINNDSCINCGLCLEVCPTIHDTDKLLLEPREMFALWSQNTYLRLFSSSGGIISSLIFDIIDRDGLVCGASFTDDFSIVRHILIDNSVDAFLMFGSKYLQSNNSEAFKLLLNTNEGKKKLVIGTPCQIYAFRNILKIKNIEGDFYLVDFFCHGVPSYLLWWSFISEIKSKIGNILHLEFRFKDKNWHNYKLRAIGTKGIYIKKFEDTLFGRFYFSNFFLRENCYNCKYTYNSAADIRVGDFWGKFFDKDIMGISIGLIYTEKGFHLIANNKNIKTWSLPVSFLKEVQPRYSNPIISKPYNNKIAFDMLKKRKNLKVIYRRFLFFRYLKVKLKKYFYMFIKTITPKFIFRLAKLYNTIKKLL